MYLVKMRSFTVLLMVVVSLTEARMAIKSSKKTAPKIDTTVSAQTKPAAKPNPKTKPIASASNSKPDSLSGKASSDSILSLASIVPDSTLPSLIYKNQDIRNVLRLLTAPYNINLYMSPQVKGRLSVRWTNIKLLDALTFIIEQNGYAYEIEKGIVKIFKARPPPKPKPPPPPKITQVLDVEKDKLTIDLKKADLDSVIRWVTRKTGINLVADKTVKGKVSGYFVNMPIYKGLEVLLESNGFELKRSRDVYYVTRLESEFAKAKRGGRLAVSVKDSMVTFEVSDAPISALVREIAAQANLDIYLYGQIDGTITARISSQHIDDAFESLLRNTKYTFWKSRGTYYTGEKSMYQKHVSRLIKLRHIKPDIANSLLPKEITKESTIKVVKEFHAIMVIAPNNEYIDQVESYLAKIDEPVAQVRIEAWVVDVSLNKLRSYGLRLFTDLGNDSGAKSETYFPDISLSGSRQGIQDKAQKFLEFFSIRKVVSLPKNFAAQIEALESEGLADVISKPQVATLNGHPASISLGETQYFLIEKTIVDPNDRNTIIATDKRFHPISADIKLSVTPWVSANNEVTVEINPEFNIPKGTLDPEIQPAINRRSLKSTVRVHDGDMIVLGGMIQTSKQDTRRGLPILGSIPILKWFFSTKSTSKSKSQLMIYLVPYISYGNENTVDPDSVTNMINR